MARQGPNIWLRRAILATICLIVTAAVLFWFIAPLSRGESGQTDSPIVKTSSTKPVLPEPELQLYKPITAEQAVQENGQLSFSTAPVEQALPLVLPPSQLLPIGRRNAIDCLTSAIYYESGNETNQGKRGVAQVVLNRARHPAFPNSICAVVYQGAERRTGCQFTFTCDGSLARQPARDRWDKARYVAIGAISGAVEPTVGMATHYHANYVLPYWAPSLDKVAQVGTHIFYRWKGAWGKRRAFVQTVQLDNEEPFKSLTDEIPIGLDDEIVEPAAPIASPSRIIADDLPSAKTRVQPSPSVTSPNTSEIRADDTHSILTADERTSTLKND